MRKNDTKIFLDKQKLTQMLNMRRSGYALTSLAIIFGVDRTSIAYQCDKYLIKPLEETYTLERIIEDVLEQVYKPEPEKFKVIDGHRINLGKTYAEYLAEAKVVIPIEKTVIFTKLYI